jgi:penicillin-binding protein 1A
LVLLVLVAGLAAAGAAGFAALLWRADHLVAEGPRPPEVQRPALLLLTQTDEVFASRGAFVGADVGPEALPDVLVQAVTSIEDRRFFEHGAVDLRGIARAAYTNAQAGGVREGGSTITQQLAKLAYLTPERRFRRKVEELFIALALERR